ncbi:MAG: COR domain-containing protein, partial [Microcystaceae cyanobacterium]
KLYSLTLLDIINNQLTNLPIKIGKFTRFISLNLSNNQLTTLPTAIGKLTSLTSLNLSNNQLTTLPTEIGKLTSLTSLDLSSNQLTTLSLKIGKLTRLISLNLSENKFTHIPTILGILPTTTRLKYENNPLVSPPSSIRKKGIHAIRNFLKQRLEQDIDYLYEAKLLIVGEGGAGKTTLAQKIQNFNYKLKEEDSTQGIDIIQYHFPLENGEKFQINIWDFGGQEIYHETHQFFLTERSLYVLVVDCRKEDTDFYYWLNVVELLSNNSPILIIKNQRQERDRDINERQLKSDFPELIKETLATNFATNRGLPEILTHIKHHIQTLPHIGEALPSYWVKVRETLEEDSRNYISRDEFIKLCKQHGFKELEDILTLSVHLHNLGVFLHFQDDDLLSKTVILKPEWGTNAVYKVLDTPKIRQSLGRFNKADLAKIWQAEDYTMMRGELLRLMINFKLCYEIPSQKDHYIAPQLLSANQPEYEWDEENNLLLRYEYEFMPKGMITRFIVETHKAIENEDLVWKTGVVLQKEDTRAEIKELYRYHKGEIRIRVIGKRKRDLLTTVRHELGKIHDSYERLKYKTLVPCNCSECKNAQTPHFYDWKVLNRAIDKGKQTIECQISFEQVNIQGLINDLDLISPYPNDQPPSDNKVKGNYYDFRGATLGGGFTEGNYDGDVNNS